MFYSHDKLSVEGFKEWWNKSPSTSYSTVAPAVRVVTPTAEIYRQQQQDKEQGLTPVKPTPSYGANSVVNQPAQAQAAAAPVAPTPSLQEQQYRQKLAEENAIRNDYDRIRFMEQTGVPAVRARQETQFYQARCQSPRHT